MAALMYMAYPFSGSLNWLDAQPCLHALATSGIELQPAFGVAGNRGMQARYMLKLIAEYAFMVFDDIGIKAATDSMNDALLEVIKARQGKPTVFTSNLSPQQLSEVYDDRVVDRICAGHSIEFKGKSQRTGI